MAKNSKEPIEEYKESAERMQEFIEATGMSQAAIARHAEIDSSTISRIKNAVQVMGDDVIAALTLNFDVNADWLKSGKGIRGSCNAIPKPEPDKQDEPEKEAKSSERSKSHTLFTEIPEKDAELYIPYYDVEITAGLIELYFDDIDEEPDGYIYAPQYRDCVACNVKGDSMYDRIFPGSRLFVYPIKNKKYIDFGQIYLIVLDGYRLLKYIDPDPEDNTKVILRSYNQHYKPWQVEKVDILHLFLVKGYENQNAM
ncbi:hypothetical protein GCM10028805_22810 [Spirosoma harenae]